MAAAPTRVISMPATAITTIAPRPAETALQRVILYGTAALLMFGPLAFGAVDPWSIFVLEAGSAVLFLLWAALQMLKPAIHVRPSPLFAPMLLFVAVVLTQILLNLTAYQHATTTMALQYAAYGALCFVALQTVDTPFTQTRLSGVLTIFGSVVALFALIQGLSSSGKLYWVHTPKFGGWVYGPYVNHNHYAGLMEMLLPIPLLLWFLDETGGTRRALLAFASLLMAATIFLSGSRGGMIAFSVEALLLVAIAARRRRHASTVTTTIMFAVLLVTLISWLGWNSVAGRWQDIHRVQGTELSAGGRLAIYKDCLHMIAARPFLGWGLGNFVTVYPQFRSFYTSMYVNAAHNDYLQLLVETGAMGGLAALWFVLILLRRGLGYFRTLTGSHRNVFPLAALVGCMGILVHSLVDFNLQIPANAALFYVLAVLSTGPEH